MSPAGTAVGFVGLGNMGGRIVRRLVDAGFCVVGYDLDSERVRAAGAEPVDTISSLVARAGVGFLSLPDSRAVEEVVAGPAGIAAAAKVSPMADRVVVDLSTSQPNSTRMLHGLLADVDVELVDAGVSGGAAAAERGTLTVMAGAADPTCVERLQPLFNAFASRVTYMGAPGAGHATKLLNNFLNAVSLAATAEVMVAAKRGGLDLRAVLDVINASSGVNFATLQRFPRIIEGDYLEGGLTNALMMKDVIAYVDHLRDIGVPSLSAAGPLAAFGAAINLGYGDLISNRVVDAIGDIAGGARLHDSSEER